VVELEGRRSDRQGVDRWIENPQRAENACDHRWLQRAPRELSASSEGPGEASIEVEGYALGNKRP
jgi:hypothetical protein